MFHGLQIQSVRKSVIKRFSGFPPEVKAITANNFYWGILWVLHYSRTDITQVLAAETTEPSAVCKLCRLIAWDIANHDPKEDMDRYRKLVDGLQQVLDHESLAARIEAVGALGWMGHAGLLDHLSKR